jgi:hypothetical protein
VASALGRGSTFYFALRGDGAAQEPIISHLNTRCTMLASWLVPAAILAAFVLLALLPIAEALLSPSRRVAYSCPWAMATVTVHLVRRRIFGITEPVDVCSCSAFRDAQHPTCGKPCLRVLSLRHERIPMR